MRESGFRSLLTSHRAVACLNNFGFPRLSTGWSHAPCINAARYSLHERETCILKVSALVTVNRSRNGILRHSCAKRCRPTSMMYIRDMGFARPDAFRRALLKEYLYRRCDKPEGKTQPRNADE